MDRKEICRALLKAGTVRFGEFTYASGKKGPIYIDLRRLVSFPAELETISRGLSHKISEMPGVEIVLGAATAGIPPATLVAVQTGIPMCYIRKQAKGHGTKSQVEGAYEKGQKAVLLDDLITSGASKKVFLEGAREVGLEVTDMIVVLDRRNADAADLSELKVKLHSLLTLPELIEHVREEKSASEEDIARVEAWMKGEGA